MIRLSLKKYFGYFLLVSVLCAVFYPQFGEYFHNKEPLILMGILFFNLIGLSGRNILTRLKKPLRLFLAVLAINLLFASIVFINRDLISEQSFIALMLIGSSSLSLAGLVVINIFEGEKSSFVLLALLGLIISAFIFPIFVPDINSYEFITDFMLFLLAPVLLAILFQCSPYGESIEKYGSYFSIILFSILSYSVISSLPLIEVDYLVISIALIFCLFNLFWGLVIGKNQAEKISFGYASMLRNYEIPLSFAILANLKETAFVIVTFSIVSYFFLAIFLLIASKFLSNGLSRYK